MINKPNLSNDGIQRRHKILQAAIEEGVRLKKRRQAVQRIGACAVIGLAITTVVTLRSLPTGTEKKVAQDNRKIVEPSIQPTGHPFSSLQFEMVSSDSVSIEKYIVRTTDVSPSAVVLDERGLMEALTEAGVGLARSGDRAWLTRGDSVVQIY